MKTYLHLYLLEVDIVLKLDKNCQNLNAEPLYINFNKSPKFGFLFFETKYV